MGIFAAMSGIVDGDAEQVRQEIRAYVESGRLRAQLPKRDRGTILQTAKNVTVLYPSSFCDWDELAQHLSDKLQTSVFSFHIHDGDLWMFVLFKGGVRETQFNTIPNYWEELDAAAFASWAGEPEKVASATGVPVEQIAPYLKTWTDDDVDEQSEFAVPGDQFPRGSEWQLIDFMKRVGFQYPIDEQGKSLGPAFNLAR